MTTRMVTTDSCDPAADRNTIVQLDPDHPGFRDVEYRARRDRIAQIALEYKSGTLVPNASYTSEEHEVWRVVREALEPAHRKHACAEYLACFNRLELSRGHIPQLGEVSEKVQALSGFCLEPVAGLVQPRAFLESLANGVSLCTQYIRHHSTPFYTPEPDVVHELLGHAVTLTSPRLAELNRLFGEVVKRTESDQEFERLARVYWFTIEFGVMREAGEVKAYGTGLLSSAGELEAMHRAEFCARWIWTKRRVWSMTRHDTNRRCSARIHSRRCIKACAIIWRAKGNCAGPTCIVSSMAQISKATSGVALNLHHG